MVRYFTISVLLILLFSITESDAQQFDWARSYNISNSNEVAALTGDENNNAYIAGVYGASQSLPYTGDCYLLKANAAVLHYGPGASPVRYRLVIWFIPGVHSGLLVSRTGYSPMMVLVTGYPPIICL